MPEKKIKNKSCRYVAAETLNKLFKQQLPTKQLLDTLCQANKLSEPDRNLAMKLVFGVLRHKGSLDYLITQLSSVKLKKLHPFVHQALAAGLYQIFFLDSIPESAAVNEAVKSCQQAKVPKRLHGFVNGVLRNSIRQKDQLQQKLSNQQSLFPNQPQWLINRWQANYGEEITQQIIQTNKQEPALTLKVNSLKTSLDEFITTLNNNKVMAEKGAAPDAVILPDYHGKVSELAGYNDGLFQVQDSAAQLATLLLQPIRKDGQYLDCCAGLGGKTGHIVQLCTPFDAEVVAIEPEKSRQKKFRENMARLFPDQAITLHMSSIQDFAKKNTGHFSGIFVDAPCSGTGVIRRQPDISWNRREDDFLKNQKLQLEILSTAAEMVQPGGVVVYATCSLEPEENDQVIQLFLLQNEDFSLSSCSKYLPAEAAQYTRPLRANNAITGDVFAPLPEKYMDGFFAARLIKQV